MTDDQIDNAIDSVLQVLDGMFVEDASTVLFAAIHSMMEDTPPAVRAPYLDHVAQLHSILHKELASTSGVTH